MAYTVRFSKAAERQFDGLTQAVRDRVVRRLLRVAEEPPGRGVTKLQGSRQPVLYRAKVGRDHRVVDTVSDDVQLVFVTWVGDRRDAYRQR